MSVDRTLSVAFMEAHAQEAALALEARPPSEAASLLEIVSADVSAAILSTGNPHFTMSLFAELSPTRRGALLEKLPLDIAASLLRRTTPEVRATSLHTIPQELATTLNALLRFPEGTAGALMDPQVLALAGELSVQEALKRIRQAAAHVLYNLYIVDREQALVGVLNLQELLLADRQLLLTDIMQRPDHRLRASARAQAILDHVGWRSVYSLPVVDEQDHFLGAVRYATLRRLEEELADGDRSPGSPTAEALGDLFSTGLAGLLEVVAPKRRPPGEAR